MRPETLELIRSSGLEKGDVLGVARIAGIMGAKSTSQLIPMCHPLPLDQVSVEFELDGERGAVQITATARTTARTGVEMEAMTAVTVAALTVYDMCKAVDRGIRVDNVRLVRKRRRQERRTSFSKRSLGLRPLWSKYGCRRWTASSDVEA